MKNKLGFLTPCLKEIDVKKLEYHVLDGDRWFTPICCNDCYIDPKKKKEHRNNCPFHFGKESVNSRYFNTLVKWYKGKKLREKNQTLDNFL